MTQTMSIQPNTTDLTNTLELIHVIADGQTKVAAKAFIAVINHYHVDTETVQRWITYTGTELAEAVGFLGDISHGKSLGATMDMLSTNPALF